MELDARIIPSQDVSTPTEVRNFGLHVLRIISRKYMQLNVRICNEVGLVAVCSSGHRVTIYSAPNTSILAPAH
jgi:hypothetical protein